MNVTIDVKILALAIIAIALVILIIYLIQVVRKLLITLTHTNKILEDVEVITDIAAKRSQDVDEIIGNVTESVESITDAIKGNQNVFSAVSAIIKAAAAVKNAVSGEDTKE